MNDFVLRPAWWIVVCGLMSTLSLTFVLPILGQHTADYSPFHQHLVTGAADPAERRQALAEHTHDGGPAPAHPSTADSAPRALSVPELPPAVVGTAAGIDHSLVCPACAPYRLIPIDAPTTSTPPSLWQQVTTTTLFGAWLSGPPPVQPPR